MAEHTEDTDDEVRALIRSHLAREGQMIKLAPLDAAAAALGYTPAEVIGLARPILAARAAAEALAPGDVAVATFADPPPPVARPKAVQSAVESAPLRSYTQRLKRIDGDVQKMRDYSLAADPDSPDGYKIKFPMHFLAAVHHQEEALKLHMKVGDAIFNLDRVEAYFKRVGEIIRDRLGEADPALADAILADFDRLNDEFVGMGSDGGN